MSMKNGIIIKDVEHAFPDESGYDVGAALEVSDRRCYDYSGSPQSIRRRRFTKGKTHTVSYTLNHFDCSDFIQAIYDLEDMVGKTGTLVLHGRSMGLVLVQSVSFAIDLDGLGSISAVGVSVSLPSARLPSAPSKAEVRTQT